MQEALSYGLLDGIDYDEELKDMREYIETNYDFQISIISVKDVLSNVIGLSGSILNPDNPF